MTYRERLKTIISADPCRMRALRHVRALGLPDCWIAAGFVRSAVWDHLHGRTCSPMPADIDVIWFDHDQASRTLDQSLQAALLCTDASLEWSVKNQARMHRRNDDPPYTSAADAMTYWPETATAVAVRLGADDELEIAAPLGLDDLFNLLIRPTAGFRGIRRDMYRDRLHGKGWLTTWPLLRTAD